VTTEKRVPEFDLMMLNGCEDPYAILAELRETSPLVRSTLGAWGVTRHEDVSALLRDKRLGHELPREYMTFVFGEGPLVDAQLNMLLNRDAPDHTRLRKLMSRAFSGIVVRRLQDHVRDLVDELLDPALERGEIDVVSELAYPLPIRMICELLGIVHVDRDEVRRKVDVLIGRDFPAAHRSAGWLREYIGSVLADRRPDPDGDLLSRMLAAEDGTDAFTHDEMVDNALLVFFAGFETVRGLIGNGIHALIEHPDQFRRLQSDPSLAPLAVEEFLRYDTPVGAVNRITLEPLEIGGRPIKAKHWVILMLTSANRDPSAFADPDSLDIGRKPNPHVGFGGGIHHCMGAMLARLEGEVVFGRLAQRVATLEAAAPPRRYDRSRSFAELPVVLTRADASSRGSVYVS
jgi:cytochrome P450